MTSQASSNTTSELQLRDSPPQNTRTLAEHGGHTIDPKADLTRASMRASTVSPTSQRSEELAGRDNGNGGGLHVEKRRKAAGFLLPSAVRRHRSDARRHGSGSKGKEKENVNAKEDDEIKRHPPSSTSLRPPSPHTPRRSNGSMMSSPLARVVVSPRPIYGDGSVSRPSTEMDSTPRSGGSSSHARASSDYTLGTDTSMTEQAHNNAIDPAQIVTMALNLSEGRRRQNMVGSQLIQPQPAGSRRLASVAAPSPAMLQGSFQNSMGGAGGSLSQYLTQARRMSRNQSPGSAGKPTSAGNRHVSQPPALDVMSSPTNGPDAFYRFSASTLARAEKARQHIELSVEYRRLLQYLPPLRPDIKLDYVSSSIPGTANVEITRSPIASQSHRNRLGRVYNPLQLVRNRKLRARNRMTLKPGTEQFSDTDVVREWIDEVQEVSERPGYRLEDRVQLPLYPENHVSTSSQVVDGHVQGHRHGDSMSKPLWQRKDWTFSPAEHLADAYWMELDSNKAQLEDKNGMKIFPTIVQHPVAPPRSSYESRRSVHSHKGSIATSQGSFDIMEDHADNRSETGRHRLPRPHVYGHHRDDSRGRLKHVWHRARRKSRSRSSGLSSSEEEHNGQARRKRVPRITSSGANIAPLEKHLGDMLKAQDPDKSPDLISPGTPNKWGKDFSRAPFSKKLQQHSDSDNIPPDSAIKDYGDRSKTNLDSNISSTEHVGHRRPLAGSRSSFEDLDSSHTNSPDFTAHVPRISMDLSAPSSRGVSPMRRKDKPLLPFKRQSNVRDNRQASDDIANSRQTSADVTSNPRQSLELPDTPERHSLQLERTTESTLGRQYRANSQERDQREIKEPQSAVRRFFKSSRLGGRPRGHKGHQKQESYSRQSDSESTHESDTEDTDANPISSKPGALRRTTPGLSKKYNSTNLPSFRSMKHNGSDTSRGADHISEQRRELLRNRSSRFSNLAPPSDLSRVTTGSSYMADVSRSETRNTESSREGRRNAQGYASHNRNRSRLGGRLEAILDVPGSVGNNGTLPATGLSGISNEKRSSRPGLKDKRQWSISDRHRSQSRDDRAPTFSVVDVARVRALLMCSGIKASQIVAKGNTKRPPPDFLRRAAEMCNAEVLPVKRSEEHILAAKLITQHLEVETEALHADAERYHTQTIRGVKDELERLRDLVNNCTKQVQDMADACVGFGSEVTGQRTLQVRQVMDNLDKLARARRRRMRWLRRFGFGLVEWTVVLFMWSVWFVVMIVRMFLAVVTGFGKAVKWILWL